LFSFVSAQKKEINWTVQMSVCLLLRFG